MNTVQIGSDIVSARPAAHAFSVTQVVPAAGAAIVFLLFVLGVAQTANPLAYLVGMSPIAWIAIEGVWRLLR